MTDGQIKHLAAIAADLAQMNEDAEPELLAVAVAQLSGLPVRGDALIRYLEVFNTYREADKAQTLVL